MPLLKELNLPVNKKPVITIDGPAGAGKSTVSKILAKRLGFIYIDTGALYRSVALAVKQAGCDPQDIHSLKKLFSQIFFDFRQTENGLSLYMNDENVSELIRTPEISMLASTTSAIPEVREFLLDIQRKMGEEGGAVFEGRDMGTVVFPKAEIKFFLMADHKVRAKRRFNELDPDSTSMEEVSKAMKQRDEQDSQRKIAPLKPDDGAIVIDSTDLDIDGVVNKMLEIIN